MPIITPTIGRKVWFYEDASYAKSYHAGDRREQDATVIDVHGDHMVSLFVIDRSGATSVRRSVPLMQENDETPNGAHAKWMPYQLGQAKATADVVKVGQAATQPDSKA